MTTSAARGLSRHDRGASDVVRPVTPRPQRSAALGARERAEFRNGYKVARVVDLARAADCSETRFSPFATARDVRLRHAARRVPAFPDTAWRAWRARAAFPSLKSSLRSRRHHQGGVSRRSARLRTWAHCLAAHARRVTGCHRNCKLPALRHDRLSQFGRHARRPRATVWRSLACGCLGASSMP